MPWSSGNLEDNPAFRVLQAQLDQVRRKMGLISTGQTKLAAVVNDQATAADKRFRIAVKTIGLSLVGAVTVEFVWSSPLPSATYKVDVNCSALMGMPTVTVVSQTATGCTVSFVPGLLATNAVVIALAVAPAATT